ncbi:MAG: hypothetical protein HUU35_17010, partial [Armatimonadetes bacterium]|nr:hypothetical protein [Armatimonadota bacterium]
LDWLVETVAEGVAQACAALQPCRLGFGHQAVFGLSHNRRVVMRDGTTRCHGSFTDPAALHLEGPIDPELAVIAAVAPDGRRLGALVNFACHPTHAGPDDFITAGWPGAMVCAMQAHGWPVGLFLNGAAGNLHHSNPCGPSLDMEPLGQALAERVEDLASNLDWRDEVKLATRRTTIQLPYRGLSEAELTGQVRGAQRFRPELYARVIPQVVERIRQRGTQPAEIQVHQLDEYALVSIPAEYFAELGLRIKEECHPCHALVVGFANGMVGYVPTREAFQRGGYETTFMATSRMAYESGDLLADAAIALIGEDVTVR